MIIKEKATILSAESKPYDFQGRQGVSHKVRANIGGEIYSLRASEKLIADLSEATGKSGDVEIKISSPKENIKLEIVSFVPGK